MADHHYRLVVQAGDPADDRRVVGKRPVAVQLVEAAEQALDVIQGVGTLGVARQLGNLPRAEVAENVFGERDALFLQLTDFFRDIDVAAAADETEFLDFRFQFRDGFFNFEETRDPTAPLCLGE